MCECKGIKWLERITYEGNTFTDEQGKILIEQGQQFPTHDIYWNCKISIAKGLTGLNGVKLFEKIVKDEKLRELNRHSSVAYPCICNR
jgi:hypothetical protein